MGYMWSGMMNEKKPPLEFYQMVNEQNLERIFPNMPASASLILLDIIKYFDQYRTIRTIENCLRYNSNILSDAIENVRFPNKKNGGIVTFDPIDGKNYSFCPAYEIGLSIAEIENALNDIDRTIEINITNFPDTISKSNQLNEPTFISSFEQSFSLENALENMINIKIEYQGYTFIPVSPLSYLENKQEIKVNSKQPNSWGWFFENAIDQAIKNSDCKNSGFCFVTPSPYNLGSLDHGGDFGRISGLLIANLPKITIYYKKVNTSLITNNILPVEGLLKMPFIQINDIYTYSKHSVDTNTDKIIFNPSNKSVELKIKSNNPKEIITVPANSKTVAVLMVAVVYPYN
jgi:hypothetical protein